MKHTEIQYFLVMAHWTSQPILHLHLVSAVISMTKTNLGERCQDEEDRKWQGVSRQVRHAGGSMFEVCRQSLKHPFVLGSVIFSYIARSKQSSPPTDSPRSRHHYEEEASLLTAQTHTNAKNKCKHNSSYNSHSSLIHVSKWLNCFFMIRTF